MSKTELSSTPSPEHVVTFSPMDCTLSDMDLPVVGFLNQLIDLTATSHDLLEEDEYSYYTTFKSFRTRMDLIGKKTYAIAERLSDIEPSFKKYDIHMDLLKDPYSLDSGFGRVVDFVDSLLDKVDMYIDHIKGRSETKIITTSKSTGISFKGRDFQILYSSNVLRPQELWKDDFDNTNTFFIPKITMADFPSSPIRSSPHVQTPAKLGPLSQSVDFNAQSPYPHPFHDELSRLVYDNEILQRRPEQIYPSLNTTPCLLIETEKDFLELSKTLTTVTEFAVDLEAHQYRSFQGMTCLMQISTRTSDYLIDTLLLRKSMHLLNSSFTNPHILKIFHGSEMDIQWLQRDFGLYVVCLFDTGQAARVLNLPSLSLAFLLSHYCQVRANKIFQKADWRVRPLSKEMLHYAQEDTHYLLYIYDKLRNQALDEGHGSNHVLLTIMERSRQLCFIKYEKPLHHVYSYIRLCLKYDIEMNPQQRSVFAQVYNWRDKVAREYDESTRYVLPNYMICLIAKHLPQDENALLNLCCPTPRLLKIHLKEFFQMINKAKEESLDLPGQEVIDKIKEGQFSKLKAIAMPTIPTILTDISIPNMSPNQNQDQNHGVSMDQMASNVEQGLNVTTLNMNDLEFNSSKLFGGDANIVFDEDEGVNEGGQQMANTIYNSISLDLFQLQFQEPMDQVEESKVETLQPALTIQPKWHREPLDDEIPLSIHQSHRPKKIKPPTIKDDNQPLTIDIKPFDYKKAISVHDHKDPVQSTKKQGQRRDAPSDLFTVESDFLPHPRGKHPRKHQKIKL